MLHQNQNHIAMPRDGPQKGHAVWPSTAITQGHPGHEVLAVGTTIFGEDGDERPGGRAGGGRGTSCGMLRLEPCWGVRLGGGGWRLAEFAGAHFAEADVSAASAILPRG